MQSPSKVVKDLFSQAIQKAFPAITHEPVITGSRFADYQCNSAMPLFKQYGRELGVNTPEEVGKKIIECLPPSDLIESCTTIPTGFVNVKINNQWISSQLQNVLKEGLKVSSDAKKRVIVDFSSPNIAKEMHVGHLRSTIIGESFCRILEFVGHEVHRVNHVGDWGTQFGMLIEYMKEAYPNFLNELPDISDLQEFYRSSKKRFDEDPAFVKRAQEMVVKLQSGDEFAFNAWQMLCEVSRKEFLKVYKRLGVVIQERGESTYNDIIPAIVKELEARNIVEESQGAKCIFTKIDSVPLMVVKADGGYGYDSTDMAAIFQRLFISRGDWLIYITDIGQQVHFHKVFEAAKLAQWYDPKKVRVEHIGLGLVQGEDGKKFKTRSGDVVKLVDLLDEARDRAYREIQNRAQQLSADGEEVVFDEEEAKLKAESMGISAVKYYDMKRDVGTNYQFSFDSMLDPKGNTAVYLLYAYARMVQLLEKCERGDATKEIAGIDVEKISIEDLQVIDAVERELAMHLCRFPEMLSLLLQDLALHKLSDYLYELSDKLSSFYTKCRVMGDQRQGSRMLLINAAKTIMKNAFHLLGMEPLDRI